MSRPVAEMRNLGPRCAEWRALIGIYDEGALHRVGAVEADRELMVQEVTKSHRMLFYALAGALEDVDCLQLAPEKKWELESEAGV